MFWHPSKSIKWNLLDRWHYYITISPGCHGDGSDKCGAETPPEYLTVCCPTLIPITPPPYLFQKTLHNLPYQVSYPSFFLQIYGSSIFSCFTISSSLSLSFVLYLLQQPRPSRLFIPVTITTTNVLTDLLPLHWGVVHARKRNKERGKEVKQCHPPTHIHNNKCTFCSSVIKNTPLALSLFFSPLHLFLPFSFCPQYAAL